MDGFTPQFNFEENIDPQNKVFGLTRGIFVADGKSIFLQLKDGTRYPLRSVGIVTERFTDNEGVLRYPRPYVYDDQGNFQNHGDIVLVFFEDGNVMNPVVVGSVIRIEKHAFFHEYTTEDFEKHKERWETENCIIEQSDDGAGEIVLNITARNNGTGNVTINLNGINGNGKITVKASGKVIVDSPLIELGKDSTEPLVLGDKWKALFQSHTHPTGTGPSGPPSQAAQAEDVLSDQNTSL
jgi:hypothetical protein